MMGSGKSTVAEWLHRAGGLPFYDTDALIERRAGKTIPAIFEESGEAGFRELERAILAETVARVPGVLSTGGGLFVDAENRRLLLDRGIVFYLHASAEMLALRTATATNRPLLGAASNVTAAAEDRIATLRCLLAKREEDYRKAHHVIDAEQRKPDAIGAEILALYQSTFHES